MYPKKIASNIQFEIQQIDKLFEKYNSLPPALVESANPVWCLRSVPNHRMGL